MKAIHKDPMASVFHPVERFIAETHDTFTLEFRPQNNNAEFRFRPGQFNMLYLYGVGEVPISISGDPANAAKIVHTVRAYGSVTSRMMTLKKGDPLGLRGPFGRGWPIETLAGHDILLCAGGIGVAPLRPVLYDILAHREKYGQVILIYGERTPGDLIYREQIEKWRGRFDLEVNVTVDSAREGWHGNVGVVTTLISRLQFDPANTFALLCGPEIMMVYTIKELKNRGMANSHIYISMERNMKCGVGFCGHCQLGPKFICKDGPVFLYSQVEHLFRKQEM